MRAYDELKQSGLYPSPGFSPPVGDDRTLRKRLTGLVQEHRDLDGAILLLLEAGSGDPLLIARLKKRKLHLKDEIARLSETCETALVSY